MRRWVLAALCVSAALAFGGSVWPRRRVAAATVPVTFSTTTTTPTSTIPAPTSQPYLGPEGIPIETGPFLAPP